ncbi:hypothetical protein FX988_02850 [Paraglaciecola mesophila]|uniref:Rap1a immunity protein domain-containing protein n=1 Tax=Paraglaciecola mesophila TaxID=197222 RepID=A0A857JMM1_9ALTE|nr:hypothetical protein [Paraglaciecola mesophila]QHJ12592.1 hypothetical protein FX988_02850 [Paraglaciecola mesophila]
MWNMSDLISLKYATRVLAGLTLLFGSSLISVQVFANPDPKQKGINSDSNVWQSCQALRENAGSAQQGVDSCYQFIRGFLYGAVLTDTQIMRGLETKKELSEFAQRAMRTRIGSGRSTDSDTYLANFCLPNPEIDQETVLAVVSFLPDTFERSQTLGEVIYQAVQSAYPCKTK